MNKGRPIQKLSEWGVFVMPVDGVAERFSLRPILIRPILI